VMESIQVPGGTQEEYVRQAQGRKDAGLDRISVVLRWTAGIILFIAVIIAAGIRGYSAFHPTPTTDSLFVKRASVTYPAFVICPMRATAIQLTECTKQTGAQTTGDCTNTAFSQTFIVEEFIYSCLVVNNPLDGSAPLAATNPNDLLNIEVTLLNTSNIIQGQPVGVYVVLYEQLHAPAFEVASSFVAGPGQWTEVWLQLNEIHNLDGTVTNDYTAIATSVPIQENIAGSYNSTIALGLGFANQGVAYTSIYYIYSTNNWVGEIGGLAFLLYMLHWVFCGILLFAYERLKKK